MSLRPCQTSTPRMIVPLQAVRTREFAGLRWKNGRSRIFVRIGGVYVIRIFVFSCLLELHCPPPLTSEHKSRPTRQFLLRSHSHGMHEKHLTDFDTSIHHLIILLVQRTCVLLLKQLVASPQISIVMRMACPRGTIHFHGTSFLREHAATKEDASPSPWRRDFTPGKHLGRRALKGPIDFHLPCEASPQLLGRPVMSPNACMWSNDGWIAL